MLSRKPKVIYSILIAISVKVVKKKKINSSCLGNKGREVTKGD